MVLACGLAAVGAAQAQVQYPAPAGAGGAPYFGYGAAYVVALVVPGGSPPVWIDFSGVLPTDGQAPADLWQSGGPLDGGQGAILGSAGGRLSGCTASGCDYVAPYVGFTGDDTFILNLNGTVCDDVTYSSGDYYCGGGSGVLTGAYATVHVLPPPPIDQDGAINTGYGQAATVTLPISGQVSSDWIVSGPSHGTAWTSGQQVTYSPGAGFWGSDAFTYQSTGPGGDSTVQTILVGVAPPPPPVSQNGAITTAYNTPASTTLLASGVLSGFTLAAGPDHGAVSLSGAVAHYAPQPGYYGADSFRFYANGPGGDSNVSTINVTVLPPPPTAQNSAVATPYNTAVSTPLLASGVIGGYALAGGPSHGSVSLSGSTATYTPAAGYFGPDSFTFTASGPGGTSNTGTVAVTVNLPPPPVSQDGAISTPYMTAATVTLPASGVITRYAIVTPPAGGTVSVSGAVATYTPRAGFYGPDRFDFDAVGPGGTSNRSTVAITVGLPPPPTPQNGALTVAYNTAGSIPLTAAGVITGYAIATPPSHGSVTLAGATATYTPTARYIGPDSFTFKVTGPGGASVAGVISVIVNPPPPPLANDASVICPYQTVCPVTLTAAGYWDTFNLVGGASNGACALSGAVLTYTPAWGAVGPDRCTFTATGPGGASAVATVYITNQAPPLPEPGGSVGAPETAAGGVATALCAAGQSASFPVLPGPPVGTSYDPNWCSEQALTIAQQALQLQNQLAAIASLQSQVTAARRQLQNLGADSVSTTLQTVNAGLAAVLQQAGGIGFNAQGAGVSFAAAYPATSTTAGFNATQLAAALAAWQGHTAAALQSSVAVQNQVAQQQAAIESAVHSAVAASDAAPGVTAATQATNQILAAVTTQLTQLQDILIAAAQAYDVAQASAQQAGAAAASVTTQTQGQVRSALTAGPGVRDTSSL